MSTVAAAGFLKASPINSQARKLFYGGSKAPKDSESDIEKMAYKFSRAGVTGKDLISRVKNSCIAERRKVIAVIKRLRREHKLRKGRTSGD
jgi:hypothetical protein